MSHAVFQTAQIMPINTQVPAKRKVFPSPNVPKLLGGTQQVALPMARKLRRGLVVKASASSSSAVVDEDSMAMLERCFKAAPSTAPSLGPVMKDKYGAFGAVTLEKSKLDMSQKQTKSSPEVSHFHTFFFF